MRSQADIILPTYNEAGHIIDLVDSLKCHVAPPINIILVDDASPDGTADLCAALRDPTIQVIRRRQRGLTTAIQTGIEACQGEIIAWLDADFSHPPDVAGELVERVRKNACDAAIASRFASGRQEPVNTSDACPARVQKKASSFVNRLLRIWLSPACTDWTSGFIAVNARFIKPIRLKGYYGDYFIRMVGELLTAHARIQEVPYESPPRRSGQSKTTESWLHLITLSRHYLTAVHMTRSILSAETASDNNKTSVPDFAINRVSQRNNRERPPSRTWLLKKDRRGNA